MANYSREQIAEILATKTISSGSFTDNMSKYNQVLRGGSIFTGSLSGEQILLFKDDFLSLKGIDNSDYNKKFGDNGKSYNKETREVTQNGRVIQNDTQNQIIRQSSIRTASEFCRGNCTIDELLDNAEIIYQWCRTGEKVDKKQDLPF